ncbi:hypothetical protein FJP65_12675 [Stenotrophomonas maltophilia]|nr:hypothetical protein FJP65_12675 [Stenotrophomonas maltophilia]
MDLRISLTFDYHGQLRFAAVAEAVQANLDRLLKISEFILAHPRVNPASSALTIFNGYSGEEFALTDAASFQIARARVGAIRPTSSTATQGSSVSFDYYDPRGEKLPEPDFESIEAIFANLNGHRLIPEKLVELLNGLDG